MSKKGQWLCALGALTERLVISTSYNALAQSTRFLQLFSYTEATKNIFQLMCALLFILLSTRFTTLQCFQNMLLMIAANNFSAGIPLPQEPSGNLVLPAIALYFALTAWGMAYATQKFPDKNIVSNITQYISLFAAARALARIQAIDQQNILGLLSFIYLMIPTNYVPPDASPLLFFLQNVDCLANRGIVIWFIAKIQVFTGISALFPNIIFFLIILLCNPVQHAPRLQNGMNVFAFYAAREIVQLMQEKIDSVVCMVLLLTLVTCIIAYGDTVSSLFRVLVMAAGVLFTAWLDHWVKSWSLNSDWMIIYLLVFIVLEQMGTYAKSATAMTGSNSKPNKEIIIESVGHHETLLGLPHVLDATGSH